MNRKVKITSFLILIFSVAMQSAGCFLKPVEEPAYADDKTITIGGWVSPPPANALGGNPDFINNDTYKQIAESGINLIYGLYEGADANGLRALDAAQANGLKYLMYDRTMTGVQEEDFDLLETSFDSYKNHPAFAGNLVTDEPGSSKFDRLAKLHEIYNRILPDKLFYVNLFPTYSSVSQRDGLSYKEYIDSYVTKVKPDFISYDYYPLMTHAVEGNYIKEDYLTNLEIVSNAAKKAGIPFWTFVQAMSFTSAGMTNREVKEEDIRWQVYTNLAFGSKGIQYFCYWSPSEDGAAQFGKAMIAADGTKTPTYDAVSAVNKEILAFDHIYLNFENKGVMLFPEGNLPNTMYMENPLKSFAPVKNVQSEQPLVIGCFEDKDGNQAMILVNYNDPSKGLSNKVTLKLNGVREVDDYAGGTKTRVKLSKNTYETTLKPGEGKFILLLK